MFSTIPLAHWSLSVNNFLWSLHHTGREQKQSFLVQWCQNGEMTYRPSLISNLNSNLSKMSTTFFLLQKYYLAVMKLKHFFQCSFLGIGYLLVLYLTWDKMTNVNFYLHTFLLVSYSIMHEKYMYEPWSRKVNLEQQLFYISR